MGYISSLDDIHLPLISELVRELMDWCRNSWIDVETHGLMAIYTHVFWCTVRSIAMFEQIKGGALEQELCWSNPTVHGQTTPSSSSSSSSSSSLEDHHHHHHHHHGSSSSWSWSNHHELSSWINHHALWFIIMSFFGIIFVTEIHQAPTPSPSPSFVAPTLPNKAEGLGFRVQLGGPVVP